MQLKGWVPDDVMKFAIPLTEVYEGTNYVIHHYTGFEPAIAISICDDMLADLTTIEPVHIYLYIIDYPHDHSRLDRLGSNNGYTQRVRTNYSIVIFRKLFWPKVLIHEMLHVLWLVNALPIPTQGPAWDEAIIEGYAVRLAIQKKYINEAEYRYYLTQAQRDALQVCGGDINVLRKKQKTPLYEYIFLSSYMRDLLDQSD